MPQVELTSQLAQLADCPAVQSVQAETLGDALANLFGQHDQLQQHVLDDAGSIHAHLAVFVDGVMIERDRLTTPVSSNGKIFVMQALSGG
jgi:hypothetical protein